MEEFRRNIVTALIDLSVFVDSEAVDYRVALSRFSKIKEDLEASQLEEDLKAKFEELEHVIRQHCRPTLNRENVQSQIIIGVSHKEIARICGVSVKTLQRKIVEWGLR